MKIPTFDLELSRGTDANITVVVHTGTGTLQAANSAAGTFRLRFRGDETTDLAVTATAATVQAALEALSTIPINCVSCTGGALGTAVVVITFSDLLDGVDPGLELEVNDGLITAGTVEIRQTRASISAYTNIWFTLKSSLADADADAVLQVTLVSTPSVITLTSGSTGEANVAIAAASWPAAVSQFKSTVLYADLQAKDASAKTHLLASGRVTVLPHATRSTS